MKSHRIAVVGLAGLLLVGCRSGGNQNQQLLERELRLQEDQIYALEDELDDAQAQLESTQYENAALKKQLSTGDRGALDSPGAPMVELPGAPSETPRRRDTPGGRGAPLGEPGIQVEPGVQIDPGEEFDPATSASGASSASRITDHNVHRIVLNKQLTGGISHSGRGGDQGILVVFEPRNKAGQMVAVPGAISIAVLDSHKQGPQSRVARWDFTAEQSQQFFHKTALGRGYHIELPWPGELPTSRKLQVFVRYVTPDGRKLMADMPLDISPPTDREAKRWRSVPAGARRSQAALRGSAPPFVSTPQPAAKFLDPPQIVPEDETVRLPERGDAEDDASQSDDREAAQKKRQDVKSARPVWSPYR